MNTVMKSGTMYDEIATSTSTVSSTTSPTSISNVDSEIDRYFRVMQFAVNENSVLYL